MTVLGAIGRSKTLETQPDRRHSPTNIAKLRRGYYEGLYAELARVTRIARGFDRNKKSWARFVKHSFWDKARKQDRPHVGRLHRQSSPYNPIMGSSSLHVSSMSSFGLVRFERTRELDVGACRPFFDGSDSLIARMFAPDE